MLNVLGHNQAAGSELLLPVPEQAERADDPEANNPLLPEPEQAAGADDPEPNNPPDIDVWDVILSFKESADLFLRYLSSKLHLRVRNKGKGSWHITVECSSFRVLEGLWEDYRSGHLNSVAQEMLVTQQVLEKLGLTELKLSTFISEDQYVRGKKLLEASSGDYCEFTNIEVLRVFTVFY